MVELFSNDYVQSQQQYKYHPTLGSFFANKWCIMQSVVNEGLLLGWYCMNIEGDFWETPQCYQPYKILTMVKMDLHSLHNYTKACNHSVMMLSSSYALAEINDCVQNMHYSNIKNAQLKYVVTFKQNMVYFIVAVYIDLEKLKDIWPYTGAQVN